MSTKPWLALEIIPRKKCEGRAKLMLLSGYDPLVQKCMLVQKRVDPSGKATLRRKALPVGIPQLWLYYNHKLVVWDRGSFLEACMKEAPE